MCVFCRSKVGVSWTLHKIREPETGRLKYSSASVRLSLALSVASRKHDIKTCNSKHRPTSTIPTTPRQPKRPPVLARQPSTLLTLQPSHIHSSASA